MADSVGAGQIATGHYARIRYDEASGRYQLLRAVDDSKDQTYFLFGLTQQQLARTLFPLGEMNKPEVRDMARSMDLAVAAKGDSQEICFVPNGDYAAFMSAYLKETGVPPRADSRRDRHCRWPRAWRARRRASLHRRPAKGTGHCRCRAAIRDRDRPAIAARHGGRNDELLRGPLLRERHQLDFDRGSDRAGPRRSEDSQQARRCAWPRCIRPPIRAASKWSSTSRSAPSRPDRERCFTMATWC